MSVSIDPVNYFAVADDENENEIESNATTNIGYVCSGWEEDEVVDNRNTIRCSPGTPNGDSSDSDVAVSYLDAIGGDDFGRESSCKEHLRDLTNKIQHEEEKTNSNSTSGYKDDEIEHIESDDDSWLESLVATKKRTKKQCSHGRAPKRKQPPTHQQQSDDVASIPDTQEQEIKFVPLYNKENDVPFCFLCEYGESTTGTMRNHWYKGLTDLIEQAAKLPIRRICNLVYEYYEKHLRYYERDQREWTVASIEEHLTEHGGLSSEACMQIMMRMQFTVAYRLSKTELVVEDNVTSKQSMHIPTLASISKVTQQYIQLDRARRTIK
jgi:hypothetical protein